jgi:hypothetical protein
MLFPHEDIWLRYPYGRRTVCNSIQEVDVYNDASWSSWLDLVQLPPTAGIPDGFYHIKRAFLKEEATDLLSPDSYVSKGYGLSSEQRKLYDWAESEDQVAEAFRVEPKLRSMTLMQEKKPRTRSYLAKWELWITVQVLASTIPFGMSNQSPILLYWRRKSQLHVSGSQLVKHFRDFYAITTGSWK